MKNKFFEIFVGQIFKKRSISPLIATILLVVRTFDGLINNLVVVEGILDLNTIKDYYKKTKPLLE